VRRVTLFLAAIAAVAVVAAPTAAGSSYQDSISGIEVAATSSQGSFDGVASGSLPGYWSAVIDHTTLSPNATITGGSFALTTYVNGAFAQVQGVFTGGTVTLENPTAQCTNQYFAVVGTLGSVGVGSAGTGTGSFDVTLTHYRKSIFGYCVTYAASVSGSLTLQL
jgi:hypothetical protein